MMVDRELLTFIFIGNFLVFSQQNLSLLCVDDLGQLALQIKEQSMNQWTTASINRGIVATMFAFGSMLTITSSAIAATLKVEFENLAPEGGTFQTPPWVGFHDGGFDIFNQGESLDGFPGTESIVEDGATDGISEQFEAVGAGEVQGTILGTDGLLGPVDPGETASMTFEVDLNDPSSQYFSYISMVIPSNDFFIANEDPLALPLFDDEGNFVGADFIVSGADVLDGGTEVNDEDPENTAFFGQQTPDTGVDENGVVTLAPGFIPVDQGGNILADPMFANADFTVADYQAARITVELAVPESASVPEPAATTGLLALGGAILLRRRQSQKSH